MLVIVEPGMDQPAAGSSAPEERQRTHALNWLLVFLLVAGSLAWVWKDLQPVLQPRQEERRFREISQSYSSAAKAEEPLRRAGFRIRLRTDSKGYSGWQAWPRRSLLWSCYEGARHMAGFPRHNRLPVGEVIYKPDGRIHSLWTSRLDGVRY